MVVAGHGFIGIEEDLDGIVDGGAAGDKFACRFSRKDWLVATESMVVSRMMILFISRAYSTPSNVNSERQARSFAWAEA